MPDELPADLGGKTLYGYLMELKNQLHARDRLYRRAVKYTDEDRENAKRAAKLTVDATTAKWRRRGPTPTCCTCGPIAYEQQYLAGGDAAMQPRGLPTTKRRSSWAALMRSRRFTTGWRATVVAAGPLSWHGAPKCLTLAEMAALLGVAEGGPVLVASDYQI